MKQTQLQSEERLLDMRAGLGRVAMLIRALVGKGFVLNLSKEEREVLEVEGGRDPAMPGETVLMAFKRLEMGRVGWKIGLLSLKA